MLTAKIDDKGHWLRADAAASYLRMVAAAGTAEGLVVGGRTYAEQKALYKAWEAGRGNLAAKPGTSLHESGLAIDVTRKSPLQLWMVHGSDPMKVTATGTTRAAEYGWLRTVPSEAWHFSYDPKRDKHVNDKPKPAEPATPPKPKSAQIKILVANLHDPRFGGPKDSVAQAEFVAKLGPDLILCSESRPIDRDDIRAKGRTKLTYPSEAGTVGMIWDGAVFEHGPRLLADFGDNYHGAVAADLKIRSIGRKLRIISTHTRPKTVATDAKKKADIQKAAKLRSGLTLLGGDLAKDRPGSWLTGWKRLTSEKLDTMDAAGHQMPDSLWASGSGMKVIKVELINPGRFSDHRWLLVTVEVSA